MAHCPRLALAALLVATAATVACGPGAGAPATADVEAGANAPDAPMAIGPTDFQLDPMWPKPLPNNWAVGNVVGVAVDARDHIWIVHRPGSLTPQERGAADDPPLADCCHPAPPVIEFNQEGDVVQAWGRPGRRIRVARLGARHLHRPYGQRLAGRERR